MRSLIAAAGGSDDGTATYLAEMENWRRYVGAVPQERMEVTRFNQTPMLETFRDAGVRLVHREYFTGF